MMANDSLDLALEMQKDGLYRSRNKTLPMRAPCQTELGRRR